VQASDVMVSNVITVGPNDSVQDIARLLLANRISAVPVLDDNSALIGIVSEGDLIHRVEAGTERRRSWWLDLLGDKGSLARDFLKSHATRAADIMTAPVITANPDMPLGEIASLLEKHKIKRVPIVHEGKVVGIVSRANLIQALAVWHKGTASKTKVDDSILRDRVFAELRSKLSASVSHINVIVHDGTVELWGGVDSLEEKRALRVAAELVPGVQAVIDHVAIEKWHHGA